ncbi:MAG: alpha/beta hydrolase fold domain-containing protein [Phycisphaerales bacterium]|nr:alpha/beta hydrolase fold domain-containing protein [Phycisphaerales bacterium]
MPSVLIAALTLSLAGDLHPDMRPIIEEMAAMNIDALLKQGPQQAQQQVNAWTPPPCDIEIAEVRDLVIEGSQAAIEARLYHPAPGLPLGLVVWFHGGGWTWGTLDMTDSIARFIADEAAVAVLTVRYRCAPQDVFPAAPTDCADATIWASKNAEELGVDPNRIAVGGDSAGGNLAAVTANILRYRKHEPPLRAQFLLYPALDAVGQHASMRTLGTGYGLEARWMRWFYDVYDPGGRNRSDACLSPMCERDLSNLPHAIVMPAQYDPLRDEAIAYAACLGTAGTAVDLMVAPGMIHGFADFWPRSQAAAVVLRSGLQRLRHVIYGPAPQGIDLLDLDRDGLLQPFEAADALRQMESLLEQQPLNLGSIRLLAKTDPAAASLEADEWFGDLDADGDGLLQSAEFPQDMAPLLGELDVDGNGALSGEEFDQLMHGEGDLFSAMEVSWIIDEFDTDADGRISKKEARNDFDLHTEADADADGFVTEDELLAMLFSEEAFSIEVEGSDGLCTGTIGPASCGVMMETLLDHPNLRRLVLVDVPGSMDDETNLRLARLVRRHGLHTHVPADGEVASGGVDLFCAGVERTVEPGAMLGVHSWGSAGEAGVDLPRDDESHEMYLEYGRAMGIPDAFYWFTLEAAGPEDIHWMRPEELTRFGLITEASSQQPSPEPVMNEPNPDAITPIPKDRKKLRRAGFTKQTAVIAPNGRPIRIVAQPGVPDLAVKRARNLLRFFLTDVPGSRFGADKSAVANAMANNRAALMMPEGAHREGREPNIDAQPLYQSETPVDGSRWYLLDDRRHRDAAFEEIFHLVHDAGIGTFLQGALPEYQQLIDTQARAAIEDGRWGISVEEGVDEWLEELEEEDSLAQEYIASAIDSYYGLWSTWDETPGGMWGIYCAGSRDEMQTLDPVGVQLVEAFLPPMMHGYEALIDPSFGGMFHLTFDPERSYTHKSQWYVDATLTGKRDSGIVGNGEDNVLRGNSGNNILRGGSGVDTAVFSGPRDAYVVEQDGPMTSVRDTIADRDGTDHLESIEVLRFSDGEVRL